MQLAHLLREKGNDRGAKRVIFQKDRRRAELRWMLPRWGAILYARLEQIPLLILVLILLQTLVAAGMFWLASTQGGIAPTSKEAYSSWAKGQAYEVSYPRFQPVIYALENDLPLVKLGQDEKWAPDPYHVSDCWITSYVALSWLRWLLILAGWAEATILASAIAGRFKP